MARIWLLCGLRGPFGELLPGIYGDEKGKNTTLFLHRSVCSCVCVWGMGGTFQRPRNAGVGILPNTISSLSLLLLLLFCRSLFPPDCQTQKKRKGPLLGSQMFGGGARTPQALTHDSSATSEPASESAAVKTARNS